MKKVLIISPYFPPANAADMQRVRMSSSYFQDYNWAPTIVTVNPIHYEINQDPLLVQSLPQTTRIIEVNAFSTKWTRKLGLGALALRSLYHYKKKVNQLLKAEKFDLIYFSTTQFPICTLGAYWKNKFKIPYIIDMQDPWHSEYYQDKPKHERPPKYWLAYRLNKYLEPIAMKNVDGLIAVSDAYHQDLVKRYKLNIPTKTITFGAFSKDFEIAQQNAITSASLIKKTADKIKIGYIGRGGHDMKDALTILFKGFKKGLAEANSHFKKIEFHFLGTSYAPNGQGIKTILPIAEQMDLATFVFEQTDRIPFYQTLNTLKEFDALFICGSDDPQYTASKIYPYLMIGNPLLAIFNHQSSANSILKTCSNAHVINFSQADASDKIYSFLLNWPFQPLTINYAKFAPFTAQTMAKLQCDFFNETLKKV